MLNEHHLKENVCSVAELYKEYRVLKEAKEKTSENEDHVQKQEVQSSATGVSC